MNIFTVFLFVLSVYASDCVLQPSSHSKVGENHKINFQDDYSTNLEENDFSMSQCNTEDEHLSQTNVCEKQKIQDLNDAPRHRVRTPPPPCSKRKYLYSKEFDFEDNLVEYENLIKKNLTNTGSMDNYDLRKKNVTCPSIIEISNQGCCDSCWAVATTDVMTDRLCIKSVGTNTTRYSVMDLLSCCDFCLAIPYSNPCETGGRHELAWAYWKHIGIVSGHYIEKGRTGCRNYHVNPYIHNDPKSVGNEKKKLAGMGKCLVSTMRCPPVKYESEPKCNFERQECDAAWTGRSYKEDKMKAEECYFMERQFDGIEADIKLEILEYGPMHATMSVYEDFANMFDNRSFDQVEPYFHEYDENSVCTGHSVRIVGWGKKGNKSYWIAANSYGEEWGDRGFFHLDFDHDKPATYKKSGKERFYAGIPLF